MGTNGRAADDARQKKGAKKRPRPRRTVEAEYLAALADAVPLARWRRIVNAAADLAEKGDAKSREWLARHLLGEKPPSLLALAAEAAEGTPLGDTALLSQLVVRRKDDAHQWLLNGTDYGAARRTLEGLVRTSADAPRGEGGVEEGAPAAPTLPAAPAESLGVDG